MHYLFLESTTGLTLGLLSSDFKWIEYNKFETKKPSEIIHHEIFNLLTRSNLSKNDIELIISSGPGSYTGMRLSEGLAQIFEIDKLKVYSFLHFEVPQMCQFDSGVFVTKAFKGEYFVYEWEKNNNNKKLLTQDSFQVDNSKKYYSIEPIPEISNAETTLNLIEKMPQFIFKKIVESNQRAEPFYFRTLDEEFSKC